MVTLILPKKSISGHKFVFQVLLSTFTLIPIVRFVHIVHLNLYIKIIFVGRAAYFQCGLHVYIFFLTDSPSSVRYVLVVQSRGAYWLLAGSACVVSYVLSMRIW